jgi:hypothetical protein
VSLHKNLKSAGEWNTYCKSGKKPQDIPFNPNKVYRQKWISWGDWLGTGRIANANKTFKSFEDAREFVHSLGLKNQKGWIKEPKTEEQRKALESFANSNSNDDGENVPDIGSDEIPTLSTDKLAELVEEEGNTDPLEEKIQTPQQILSQSEYLYRIHLS